MVRHAPFWLERFPKSKRPSYPRWRGEGESAVVVIGGGLTGCACAYSLAAAGVPVVLLEASRIGGGATAASPGFIREHFDLPFESAVHRHGLRQARVLWQGMRRAALELASSLRRLRVRCGLEPFDFLQVNGGDPESERLLRRELQARRDAGLDVAWLTPARVQRQAALEGRGAIRSAGFVFDPYRGCLGLARAAAARNASLFEHSRVMRVRGRRTHVEVVTDGGSLRAGAVVVATAAPLPDLRALRRHLRTVDGYGVVTEPLAPPVKRQLGSRAAVIVDGAMPPHRVRWLNDDRVLIAGGDQPAVPARAQDHVLTQRTGQLMYELSVLYPPISGTMPGWSWPWPYAATVDGLPCIGPHRNFPRHFFALGEATHGAAVAWLAGRIATRWVRATPDKTDEIYGFGRIL
jgi:glycine/D-amino acid oxidase-like deaminating enzyme